jgi:S1-C subfamily serine protease
MGCHGAEVTTFSSTRYNPTTKVDVFTDVSTIPEPYIEIGYVEAKGGITVSKQALLNDMIADARKAGADGLIKVSFYDREQWNQTFGSIEKPGAKAVMIKYKSAVANRKGYAGFSMNADGEILSVDRDSPANKAGLLRGDKVRQINAKNIPYGDQDAIAPMLAGTPGEAIVLEVERGGKPMTISIVRQ